MKWGDFSSWLFHHWAKLNGLTILFDHSNETSFAVLLFPSATDGTKRLIIHLAYLQNSTKILVLGPHLCTRIWVCAIIGLLKKAIVDLPIRLKRNLKCISGNSFSPLETQDKDINTSSYTFMSTTQAMLLYGSIYYAAQGASDFFKKYDHSNKTSLAVLLLVTIWYEFRAVGCFS